MADQLPGGDGLPTWLVAVLSVAGTVAGWRVWKPFGAWVGQRLENERQARALERGDVVAVLKQQLDHLNVKLKATGEEMMALRIDMGEERELRMALAIENAVQRERIENLERALVEEKEECRQSVARLERELRELRRQHREPPP